MTANEAVRAIRVRSGLTQAEFAAKIGMNHQSVHLVEAGKVACTTRVAGLIRDRWGLCPLALASMSSGLDIEKHRRFLDTAVLEEVA
jgi:DNA-binding XRE family transcriptional regulator